MADNADTKTLAELQHYVNLLSPDDGIELLALFAAQQRRITELEAGLADTESMIYQANQLLWSSWSFMLNHNLIKPDDRAQALIDAVERWNLQYAARKSYDLLRAEKGE